MWRREKLLVRVSLVAVAGVALLFGTVLWLLWRDSLADEEALLGGLALSLGTRTENIVLDTRDLLASFDRLPGPRCAPAHLQAMEDAAASRPYLRAIGHWRAAERRCGVGFLQTYELKPPRADRIYDSGVIAWWPSADTEVGGVQLFLMRFGDHDAAIDPRMLLEIGPLGQRQVALWVEHLRMASQPIDADLPAPGAIDVGVHIDREAGHVVSRFSHNALLPIDVVAIEPLDRFWDRHLGTLTAGSLLGLALSATWLFAFLRHSRHRLSLAGELREALAHDRILVQYQPIVDLASGRCVGAEALARWTRENGETVPPDVFIPIAERDGLVSAITLTVLTMIVRDLRELLPRTPGFGINLNLSPEDLKTDRFGMALAERLEAAQLPAGAINLEITERALINSDGARTTIQALRQRGHQVAIDDFGTGYSSLSYLERFELDVLKIDKAFVDAIGRSAASGQVIAHVIDMARSLHLATIAEGVETEQQRRWLIEHGVLQGQGFLFSRPLNPEAFADFLRTEGVA
jgi:sensor c-di-GMP phosphodiesterase-like protein